MRRANDINRFYRLAVSHVHLRLRQKRFPVVVFFLILFLFPQWVLSQDNCPNATGDIHFIVSNNAEVNNETADYCINCGGPFFRTSGPVVIDAGVENCTFYAAKIDAFSPLGKWSCDLAPDDCDFSNPIDSVDFCVGEPDETSTDVHIDITSNDTGTSAVLKVDKKQPPCTFSVSSFLGDNPKQEKSKRDIDVFTFDGSNGDEVKLTLEADPKGGHNGGNASLGISGDSLSESTAGTLPLEIDTSLPADDEYSIMVEQPRISEDQRFRGSYILRLESSVGVDLIKPTNNVEK